MTSLLVVLVIALGIWRARHAGSMKAGLAWLLAAGVVAGLLVQAMR